eukprot:gene17711-6679_t
MPPKKPPATASQPVLYAPNHAAKDRFAAFCNGYQAKHGRKFDEEHPGDGQSARSALRTAAEKAYRTATDSDKAKMAGTCFLKRIQHRTYVSGSGRKAAPTLHPWAVSSPSAAKPKIDAAGSADAADPADAAGPADADAADRGAFSCHDAP